MISFYSKFPILIFIMNFLEHFFNLEFFQQFFITFFAVTSGIWAALFIDKKIKERQIKEEKPKLIRAIMKSLEYNAKLIPLIKTIPSFDEKATHIVIFDNSLLNAISIKKYEILNSIEICQKIDTIKYYFDLLNFQIKSMNDYHIAASISKYSLKPYQKLLDSFNDNLKITLDNIDELIKIFLSAEQNIY